MTEKRGTGSEYGQEKLKERANNADAALDEKKPKTKLKPLGFLIIAVLGVGALYPVVFNANKTPAEKTAEVTALNADGVSVNDDKTTDVTPAVSDDTPPDEKDHAADSTGLAVDGNDSVVKSELPEVASADIPAPDKPSSNTAALSTDAGIASIPAIEKDTAETSAAKSEPAKGVAETESAEQHLLSLSAPSDPSTDIEPAGKIAKDAGASGALPPEDVKGIADAVIHDPSVKATDEAKQVAQNNVDSRSFDPSKFGIDKPAVNTAPATSPQHLQSVTQAQPAIQPQPVKLTPASLAEPGSDDMLRSYTGLSSETDYHSQSQNTIYVYGTFAAKVYLLPLDKNEKVNAYLSDGKGWEVSQLPGNILRIKRAANRSDWSEATDLFLVAGKRTYTLILQAVDEPKLRTDTLRYVDSVKNASLSKKK